MNIKVFGAGCSKCKLLEKYTLEAIQQLNLEADYSKVEDIQQIIDAGVLITPALMINGEIVLAGKATSTRNIVKVISKKINP